MCLSRLMTSSTCLSLVGYATRGGTLHFMAPIEDDIDAIMRTYRLHPSTITGHLFYTLVEAARERAVIDIELKCKGIDPP